jgi:GNAT superfamily N-acetyltransferase
MAWSGTAANRPGASRCTDTIRVWVADAAPVIADFVAAQVHQADRLGEISMLAVDPAHQRQGIAAELIDSAMRWLADSGMNIAMVETGGDPGHAPARATYENAGFTLFPISRYFMVL